MISLRSFLSDVLLLQPSVFDDLVSNGVTDDLQECTLFLSADDWKEVLSDERRGVAVVKKLTRLSELIALTCVDEVGQIRTLEEFNAKYTKTMETMKPPSTTKAPNRNHQKKQKHHGREHTEKLDDRKAKKRRLALEDIDAPTSTEDDMIYPASAPSRYEAIARGTMWVRDGALRFDGKWATSVECFETGPTTEISFWLDPPPAPDKDQHKPIGGLKHCDDDKNNDDGDGGKVVPVDSSDYKGMFKVDRGDGEYDTVEDDELVLKFREHSLGGYNIYGKGINVFGTFLICGTVESQWCNATSSRVELYRTYLFEPELDEAETLPTITGADDYPKQALPIGTAVRHYSEPKGDKVCKPFVGYVVGIFDYDAIIDGKAVKIPIHKILYEDGDEEDLDFENAEPHVKMAQMHNITNMTLTEVSAWEANIRRKYAVNASAVLSPSKSIPKPALQRDLPVEKNHQQQLLQHVHNRPPAATAAAIAPGETEADTINQHSYQQLLVRCQPPTATPSNVHQQHAYHQTPVAQRLTERPSHDQPLVAANAPRPYDTYVQPSVEQNVPQQQRTYHQAPAETQTAGGGQDQLSSMQQQQAEKQQTDVMKQFIHILVKYLERDYPDDLHPRALHVIRTWSRNYQSATRIKYTNILQSLKYLVGSEVWYKVKTHWVKEIRRTSRSHPRSRQSPQQDSSQGVTAVGNGYGSVSANEPQNPGDATLQRRRMQQQQCTMRPIHPTYREGSHYSRLPPTSQQPQYGDHTDDGSPPPAYGKRSYYHQQPSIAHQPQYHAHEYAHPKHAPVQPIYAGAADFRPPHPSAHQPQHRMIHRHHYHHYCPRRSINAKNYDTIDLTTGESNDENHHETQHFSSGENPAQDQLQDEPLNDKKRRNIDSTQRYDTIRNSIERELRPNEASGNKNENLHPTQHNTADDSLIHDQPPNSEASTDNNGETINESVSRKLTKKEADGDKDSGNPLDDKDLLSDDELEENLEISRSSICRYSAEL